MSKPKERYIQRDLEIEIKKYLKSKEILAIIGTRRCGKTTLVKEILKKQKGKKINEISFEDVKILRLFEEDIDSFIDLHIKGYDFVFIDEIQYSKDSGKKLKYIYDIFWTKIIISGSSVAEISIQSLKYLVGRIFTFILYPFSFGEYLKAKDEKLLSLVSKKNLSPIIIEKLNLELEEFLIFGGYPRVVLSKTNEEKKKVLEEIFNTYLLKEIKEILDLSDNYKLVNLIKALSLQVGNVLNYSEISQLTGFNYLDLKRYLTILEKTYILKLVKPYYKNKRVEITKSPKVYFFDLGFRNVSIDNFQKERVDKGSIYENFIFSEFIKKGLHPKYWNAKSLAEVDFILEKEGNVIPIEVKSNISKKKIGKAFRSFINKYSPKKGFFLSLDYLDKLTVDKTKIYFVPFVKFIFSKI